MLDIISAPYSAEFIQVFLPLVENPDITGNIRAEDDSDKVSEFIGMYIVCLLGKYIQICQCCKLAFLVSYIQNQML